MATRSLGALTLDLIVRNGGFIRAMDESERRAQRNFKSMRENANQTSRAINSSLRNIAAGFAGAFSVREVYRATEQWTTLNNRLNLVTNSYAELIAAQQSVFAIAQRARQPLGATAELYQRIATNAKDLNLNASTLNRVVETVNKTLAISNTTGQAASAALVQLGQAFASGQLRGQELNSVLEQAPALARAIADGMGVAVGDLRQLAEEGRLTASQVLDALVQQSDVVDRQFKKITTTIGQALPVLNNSLTQAIGKFDELQGISTSAAQAILGLSGYIDNNLNEVLKTSAEVAEALAVIVGSRLAAALLNSASVSIADAQAKRQSALASAEAATQKARELATERDLANARVLAANSLAVAAAKEVAAERQSQAARIDSLKAIAAQIAAERNLEQIRFNAQITEAGRAQSTRRMAQSRIEEVAVINQIAAAEARLAQTTVASNAAASAALAEKTASEVAYTAAAGKAADASRSAAKQNAALTTSARAAALATRGLNSAMALMGGPLGVVMLAAGALLYFTTRASEGQKVLDSLGGSLDKVSVEFQKLGKAQRQVAINELRDQVAELNRELVYNQKLAAQSQRGSFVSTGATLGGMPNQMAVRTLQDYQATIERINQELNQARQRLSYIEDPAGINRVAEAVSALGDALNRSGGSAVELSEKLKTEISKEFWELVDAYEGVEDQAKKLIDSYSGISDEQRRLNEAIEISDQLRGESLIDLANQLETVARNSYMEFVKKEEQEKLDKIISSFISLEDRLDPAQAALRRFTEGQEQLTEAFDAGRISLERFLKLSGLLDQELVEAKVGDSLDKLIEGSALWSIEGIKDVKKVENAYTKAAERIDSTFASAWQNIDGGFTNLRDGIVGGFKSMLAEMAHEAITRPIVLQIQQNLTGAAGGLGGTGSGGSNAAAGAIGAGGIYGAIALAAVAAVNVWNKEQDEKFVKMTAEYRQGTQSLGTILGEQNRKSESIANLTDMLSRTAQDTLDVNYGMYKTLLDIRTGIAGVASGFAKTLIGQNNINVRQGTTTFGFDSTIRDIGDITAEMGGALPFQMLGPISSWGDINGFIQGFMGGITTEISKAIYRKKVKVTDTGIGFLGQTLSDILETGLVDAYAYADINTKKKFLGVTTSNRNRRETEDLDRILLGQFADVFDSAGDALDQAADIFGLDFQKYVDKLIVPAQSLSLKDLEGDALTQEIESFFSSTLDNWAGVLVNGTMVLEQYQQIGEGAFETVLRLAAETSSFTHYAERLGLTFDAAGMSAVNAVQQLTELSGGMDGLTSSLSTYADRFFTDSEKLIQVQEALGGAFTDLGLALPTTRDQFRDLVEGLNLATAAGREQFATLMGLTGATDNYLTALEREQQAREDALRTSVGSAFDVFNRALEEQKKALESAAGTTMELLQKDIDRVAQSLNAHQQVADSLTNTLRSMQIESAQAELMTRRSAQAELIAANAIARAGGPLPGVGQLDDALRTLAEPSQNLFATFEDYARDFYTTARNIKDLQEATGSAVTIDEKNLQALQDQLQQAQDFHDEQIAQLERLGVYYQDQINVLDGIDTSVLSVAEAIDRLTGALNDAGFTPTTPAPEVPTLSNDYQNQKTAQTLAIGNEKQSPRKRPGGVVDVTEEEEADLVVLMKRLVEDLGVSQLAIAKNTQKTSKVLERWDIDGLPEERT